MFINDKVIFLIPQGRNLQEFVDEIRILIAKKGITYPIYVYNEDHQIIVRVQFGVESLLATLKSSFEQDNRVIYANLKFTNEPNETLEQFSDRVSKLLTGPVVTTKLCFIYNTQLFFLHWEIGLIPVLQL